MLLFLVGMMALLLYAVLTSLMEIADSHKQLTEAFNQQAQRYTALCCILEFKI